MDVDSFRRVTVQAVLSLLQHRTLHLDFLLLEVLVHRVILQSRSSVMVQVRPFVSTVGLQVQVVIRQFQLSRVSGFQMYLPVEKLHCKLIRL